MYDSYKLSFHAEGETDKHLSVKLLQFQTAKVIISETVAVGTDITLYFDITDEEATAIRPADVCPPASNSYYTLGGRQTAHPSKGVHVKDTKKVVIR